MKISKNFIQIISILIIILILLTISYVFNTGNSHLANTVKDTNNKGQSTDNVVLPKHYFIIKEQLNSMGGTGENVAYTDIQIPQIVNTNNNKVWDKINQDIVRDFRSGACPDLEDINSINDAFDAAKNFSNDENYKEEGKLKASITKEEKLKYIMSSGIGNSWYATSTYINNHIFSVRVDSYSECGGAHPSGAVYGLNYNLDKWKVNVNKKEGTQNSDYDITEVNKDVKQIDFSDIFANYEKDKVAIEKIVLDKVNKTYDATGSDQKSCFDDIQGVYDDFSSYGMEPFQYSLNAKGINLLSFGLPHVIAACEPTPTLIPYDSLRPYIKPEFLNMFK